MEYKTFEMKKRLRQLILDNGLKWAEGKNKSGKPTKWIFDLREVILTPEGSNLATLLLFEKLNKLEFDYIGGPTLAAEPIVASLILYSYLSNKQFSGFVVREKPNDYGLRKTIECPIKDGKNVILIDDAINSGDSVFKAIKILNEKGFKIIAVLTILDFCSSGHKKLLDNKIDVDYIFNLHDFGLSGIESITYNKNHYIKSTATKLNRDDNKSNLKYRLRFNDNIFIVDNEDNLFCVDSLGKEIWKTKIGEVFAQPVIDEKTHLLLVSTFSGLRKGSLNFFDIGSGVFIDSIKTNGAVCIEPVFDEDLLFIGSNDKNVYCIDRYKRNILWTFKTQGKIRTNFNTDKGLNTLYASSSDGYLYSIRYDGKLVWKRHIGKHQLSKPEICNGKVLVLSDINVLFAIDGLNGNIKWFFYPKNQIKNFKLADDKIFVWCNNGFLYILDNATDKTQSNIKLNDEISNITKSDKTLILCGENGNYNLEL